MSVLPATLSSFPKWNPRGFQARWEIYIACSKLWVYPWIPAGLAWKTFKETHGHILIKCSNHPLAPFNVKEQWLYSNFTSDVWAPHPITETGPGHPTEDTHFGSFYLWSYSLITKVMTIGKGFTAFPFGSAPSSPLQCNTKPSHCWCKDPKQLSRLIAW